MQDNHKDPSLPLKDYLVAATLCGVFFFLAISSFFKPYPLPGKARPRSKHAQVVEQIHVQVKGHVKYPGTYWVKKNSTVQELLDRAQPLEFADLRRLKLKALIKKPRSLNIRQHKLVTIYLYGAVKNPGPRTLPACTRLMDVPQYVEFSEAVDLSKLKYKRKVRNQEEIWLEKLPNDAN